jgi:hypothetical protein
MELIKLSSNQMMVQKPPLANVAAITAALSQLASKAHNWK